MLQVKADIYSLSGFPCRYQCWTGWPIKVTDDVGDVAVYFCVKLTKPVACVFYIS